MVVVVIVTAAVVVVIVPSMFFFKTCSKLQIPVKVVENVYQQCLTVLF